MMNLNSLLLACTACWLASGSFAAEAGPMVIGFERFARHQELTDDQAGALLLTELSCTACHATNRNGWEAKAGPRLESAGRRLQADWLAAFLNDPATVKPGTTMPDMLMGLEPARKQRVVAALTAFLSSQQSPWPELKASGLVPVMHEFWSKGNVQRGRELFHQVGCVACHEPSPDYAGGLPTNADMQDMLDQLEPEQVARLGLTHAIRTIPSVPMANLRAKYTLQGLAFFLFDPSTVRPSGRMPSFKLRTADAADLAAYLMSTSSNETPVAPAGLQPQLRDEGQRLFAELGCANCHSAAGVKPRMASKPLHALSASAKRSCLARESAAGVPHYRLDDDQRKSVVAALANNRSQHLAARPKQGGAQAQAAAREQVMLSMLQLNCYACHQREQLGGVARGRDRYFETNGQVDLGDEGRLPPPLSGAGRKLTTSWLQAVLRGNADIRPHLQIRMPLYPVSEVEGLPNLLTASDGVAAAEGTKPPTAVDPVLAAAGRELFNLGCVQCHPLRGESLPSVVGVDVGRIGFRIRSQWFHDFLLDPASLKPRTRMPTFFAEGSVNKEILKGHVEQQIQALWIYLEDVYRQPLPEKIEQARRQNFELVPRDRPIVFRTFMQLAGTHAIAVGFPEHVHYAFDAESVRLAELWGNRFLDAQGTWNDRFAPPAMPLSEVRIPLPQGPDWAILRSAVSAWPEWDGGTREPAGGSWPTFLGYRLDRAGVPEFDYRLGEYAIRDRLTPGSDAAAGQHEFTRRLSVARQSVDGIGPAAPSSLWYRVAGSSKPLKRNGSTWTYASGLKVTLPESMASCTSDRSAGTQSLVIVPINVDQEPTFEIHYSW